jgi:hypothetical protein
MISLVQWHFSPSFEGAVSICSFFEVVIFFISPFEGAVSVCSFF